MYHIHLAGPTRTTLAMAVLMHYMRYLRIRAKAMLVQQALPCCELRWWVIICTLAWYAGILLNMGYSRMRAQYYPIPGLDLALTMPACPARDGGRLGHAYRDDYVHTRFLYHAPAHPNWPPELSGPCMAQDSRYVLSTAPVFTVAVASFNREREVRKVLVQLLKLTQEPWELIWVDDGSTDGSMRIVMDTLDGYARGDWEECETGDPDEDDVWPDASTEPSYEDIGVECILDAMAPRSLVRARVVSIPGTGLLEAFDNNLQMRMAHPDSEFYVLFQDDQFMTSPGWNTQLAMPLREYGDMFSASMRCAHGYPESAGVLTGAKCLDPNARHDLPWALYIRDSGNRGPMILRANMTRDLGYLDEITTGFTPIGAADHEINIRAYAHAQWKSGFVPVPFTQFASVSGLGRSPSTPLEMKLHGQMMVWNAERTREALRGRGKGLQTPPPKSSAHDETRPLPPRRSRTTTPSWWVMFRD